MSTDGTTLGSGQKTMTERAQELPHTKVVVLTVSETAEDVLEAVRCGARGYLVESAAAPEFFDLLESVARGDSALAPGLAMKIVQMLAGRGGATTPPGAELTPREEEVLRLVAKGHTNREVAQALDVSETTVKSHMTNILARLHLHNRAQVVAYAHEHGLTSGQRHP
jgi:two-component system, NarL family, nitrate/nitrite response regulator NarL